MARVYFCLLQEGKKLARWQNRAPAVSVGEQPEPGTVYREIPALLGEPSAGHANASVPLDTIVAGWLRLMHKPKNFYRFCPYLRFGTCKPV